MIPQNILSFFHDAKSWPFRSMTYFNFLLEATLAGSILILVMLVLRRVFRRQIGSRLVYVAWALVAVRLLLPFAIPNPLMDELRPTYSTDAGARPVADQFRVRVQDAMRDVSYAVYSPSTSYEPLSTVQYEEENNAPLRQGLHTLLQELTTYTSYGWLGKAYLLCYVAGGLIVAGVFMVRHARFRRRLKKNTIGTLEGEQLVLYQQLCTRLHVKQLPVLLVDPLTSPCLVGVWKPVIALPLTLPPDALCEALLHELSHYRAKDSWWGLLQCVCCVVHWFNPLVWLAQRAVKMDRELACDERVAKKLTEAERLHYANTLIVTAKRAYMPRTGVLSTGMSMTGKRLKRRVNALLHMKAVQRAAASAVAVVLVLLTVAAFSTAESTTQTQRLTSDQSAFPFETTDLYPMPDVVFGQPVALASLTNVTEATEQAKRYLRALYPEKQVELEQYRYRVQAFGQDSWEIIVSPAEDGATSLFYMELKNNGRLVSVHQLDAFASGGERQNVPSVLPDNLKEILLAYGQQLSDVVLQGDALDTGFIHEDMETSEGRYVVFDLYSGSSIDSASITVQIAPEFRLLYVSSRSGNHEESAPEAQPSGTAGHRLTYTKDASLAFDATFLGDTDSEYALSPDAVLTVQQAFDFAVDTMLERSGLTKEEMLKLPLQYGYHDKSHSESDVSSWRFIWVVDADMPMERYWVHLFDEEIPSDIVLSAPGEGLG